MDTEDKLKIEQVINGETRVILLNGTIDEDADFSSIAKIAGDLTFNFKNVESINSCGVRNWVNFLKARGEKAVHFEECPPLIVRQMNMVPSFVGSAQVKSVYANYVCDKCEKEKLILLSDTEFKNGATALKETIPCDCEKKGEMEFDGHPKQYFAFSK